MMAYRGRAAINRRELTLSLVGLCMGTAVGAWGLSLVAPASLTKLFALLILVAVLVSLIGTGVVSRASALRPGRAVWLREASANVPACAPRPLRNHAQHGGTKPFLK